MLRKIIAISLLLGPASALAQAESVEPAKPAAKVKNADRMICEKVETIGSRLAARKICMTASQWTDKRRSDRESIEEVQRRNHMPGQ